MNRVIILILLSIVCNISRGQISDLGKFETNYLQIRQKPGTDHLLKEYVARAHCLEDTVYAFVYTPGLCPRCEGMLKVFHEELQANGKKLLLVTIFPDEKVSRLYNKKKEYKAEYNIYDTNKDILSIFSFNRAALLGAYILKISKQGRLISGGNNSIMGPQFIKQLVDKTEPLPYKDFSNVEDTNNEFVPLYTLKAQTLKAYHDMSVTMPDSTWLCGITGYPVWNKNDLFYADKVMQTMLLFKQSGNTMLFNSVLQPTDKECRRFVSISPEAYADQMRRGMLFRIICNVNMLDSTHYGMSYSLPELKYQEDYIAYYNGACILSRKVKDCSPDSLTYFDFDLDSSKYFFQHFKFSSTGDKVFLACQKLTWPMEYDPKDYKDKVDMNPFNEKFYQTSNPIVAVFDRYSGKLITQFGHLSEMARKTRTGYGFVSLVTTVSGNELAYSDGSSGKVYVVDTADVHHDKNCYDVFDISDKDLPTIDTTKFYTDDYMMPYWKVVCRNIEDIRLTPHFLYCIVAYGNFYEQRGHACEASFVRINRKTGRREEWAFPKGYGKYTMFARGLRTTANGDVFPFATLKKEGKAFLRTFYPYSPKVK